ncbi:MAG: outer membrane protein assembly factor BamD, partial [candidate division Zixibacteria bacterium]|nr:outer membrane protein assembly factor BamD [candidate division Zixibacteria bacterium]
MMRKLYLFTVVLLVLGCAGSRKDTPLLGAENQFEQAKREYMSKHWDEARLEFQKLIYNYPGVVFVDSAQFLLGMCYYQEKDYPAAVGEFKKMLVSFSQSHLADDAAFMTASAHFMNSPKSPLDQQSTIQVVGELQDFLQEYPQSEHAVRA